MQRFPTYGNLVRNENDLIGLIAYSLYKQDKLAFVDDHKNGGGSEPSDDQMETFCRSSNLPNRLVSYREAAASLLEKINDEMLETSIEQIEENYKADIVNQVKKLEEPSMRRDIVTHALAGIAVWAIVGLLIFCGLVLRNGFTATIHGLTGYEVKSPVK